MKTYYFLTMFIVCFALNILGQNREPEKEVILLIKEITRRTV